MEVFREGVSSGKEMGAVSCTLERGGVCLQLCLFLCPLLPAVLDALGCIPGPIRQAARSPRERLTWTQILFIAEDEQGRLVFTTSIG